MPTTTITDEELHEIVEVLNYRVLAYRSAPPLHGDKKLSPAAVAWIDRYEARINVTIKKLEGVLNDPVNPCDPYHLKQIASWNKCLDERLNTIKEAIGILKFFDDGCVCVAIGKDHISPCPRCMAREFIKKNSC